MDGPALGAGITLARELLGVDKVTQILLILRSSREEGKALLGAFYLLGRGSCPQIFLSIPQLSLFLLWDAQRFPMFSRGCSKPQQELGVVFNEGMRALPALLGSPGGNNP